MDDRHKIEETSPAFDFPLNVKEDDMLLDDCGALDIFNEISSEYDDYMEICKISWSGGDFVDALDTFEFGEVHVIEEASFGGMLVEIQDNFIGYIKEAELKTYGRSFVQQLFQRYDCPLEEIISKSRTELWLENTIYGLHFQAFLCLQLKVPLPLVTLNYNETQPTKRARKTRYDDPILEALIESCRDNSKASYFKKRLAPRHQISLLIFVLDLLNHPYFQDCIKWRDKVSLTFEIMEPKTVAYYWMVVKENRNCSFENFTRAIRFKRNSGVFKHIEHKKRRVYQFQRKALKDYSYKRTSNLLTNVLIKILDEG